jgi:hypothetical protein
MMQVALEYSIVKDDTKINDHYGDAFMRFCHTGEVALEIINEKVDYENPLLSLRIFQC